MSVMQRVGLVPGYVLHGRPYRDTSVLLDTFTPDHGRVGIVARGARGPRSRLASVLQPFQPLLLSWTGRGELHTLCGAEPQGVASPLHGDALLCGFYLNELLLRLAPRGDAQPPLFARYAATLDTLASAPDAVARETCLRIFEKRLLEALGYGLGLERDIEGLPISPALEYCYRVDLGAQRCGMDARAGMMLSGGSLLALAHETWTERSALQDAKRLLRAALAPHLGRLPLRSRAVWQAMRVGSFRLGEPLS